MTCPVRISEVLGGGYNHFWNSRKRYRVLKGGKGSKKSTTTALNLIHRIMKYKDSNALVVRAVMNTHRDSTFAQLKWAQEKLNVSHLWQNNVSPMEMTYKPTGQKILFRGFDDVLKLASTTVSKGYLCFVWVEEAYEIESEADFEKLDLSVPRGNVPAHLFKQTTITFNPWSEYHWLKKRFFDKESDDTDTYTTNYLVNEYLDSTDIAVFERMRDSNPRRYAVAGLGEWGVAEGLIFENWEVLEFDEGELGIERGENGEITEDNSFEYKRFYGLDYGYTNDPTAFIAFAANPKYKELYIFEEHYERRMLNSDIADMIKRKGFAKEIIRADAAEPKSNEDLRRLGITRVRPSIKGKDSIINGITALQEYKIYVSERCKNTISELSNYRWKVSSDNKLFNVPEDDNNHLMDALRYAFYDVRFFRGEKPERVRKGSLDITAEDMKGGWE